MSASSADAAAHSRLLNFKHYDSQNKFPSICSASENSGLLIPFAKYVFDETYLAPLDIQSLFSYKL